MTRTCGRAGGKPLKIGMVYDLRDEYLAQGYSYEQVGEFDSDSTIQAIEQALQSLGFATERIGSGRALAKRLAAGDRWDLVFNIAEGLHGRSREAQVPALLEMYDIAYTFSDPLVCALTLDKAVTKRLIQSANLNTPGFFLVTDPKDISNVKLEYPLFAKPVAEGTGKGIDAASRISSPEQLGRVCLKLLERYNQPVLVEEYLPGREFTTAIVGTDENARILGTMEFTIKPDAPAVDYSFEVKEKCEDFVQYFPMPKGELRREVEELALAAYRLVQCRDAGRVDIRLDSKGRPSFIEINPLPGLHPVHSDLPMIATQEGMSYAELVGSIVKSAMTRQGIV